MTDIFTGERIIDPARSATDQICQSIFLAANPKAPIPLAPVHYQRVHAAVYAALLTMLQPMEKTLERMHAMDAALKGAEKDSQRLMRLQHAVQLVVNQIKETAAPNEWSARDWARQLSEAIQDTDAM